MAYTPKNTPDEELKLRADSAIAADSYNLTPDFFDKNKEIYEKINSSINSIVKIYGYNNKANSDIVNPLKSYNQVLYNTLDKSQIQKKIVNSPESNLSSGMRSIANEDTGENTELSIINSFQRIVSESFALMEEYRISVSLIPELKRVVKLIVRDILNSNEITKRCIINPYKIDGKNATDNIEEETVDDVKIINNILTDNVTDEYKIEEKLYIWLYEALISGAKPIMVIPYKDIVKSALALSSSKNKNNDKSNFSMEDYNEMSLESLDDLAIESIDINNLDHMIKNDIYEPKKVKKMKYNYKSQEDKEEYTKSFEGFTNNIITDDIINELYEIGMEELIDTYSYEKQLADSKKEEHLAMGIESDESSIYNTVNAIKSVIDNIESPKSDDEKEDEESLKKNIEQQRKIKEKIKSALGEFICKIDDNINIVQPDYVNLSMGKTEMFNRFKTKKMNKQSIDGIYIDNADKIEAISNEKFDKEVLILELDPEFVIPVSIGSQHVQYYIYEASAYTGPTSSSTRKNTSFASIIASTGFGNDNATINASNGVSITPNDPALSSVFNPANFGNINLPIDGTSMMENNKRVEILKQILFKTLSNKMCDPTLMDNKAFTDTIMTLIRDGYIIEREVKFTSVPATNVVYFAHDIDDKGMPHSIFDGSLLQIYMYLAGIVSMTMDIVKKSSDKEKLEVNMGMSHQVGMSLMEIQKQLSTRNIHVRSFFDNIGSVLRNVSTYARYTIPVVDGEKLYEVSNTEQPGGSPIDTDFIEKRLSSILSALPCPPAIQNMINEAEFSRGLLNQSIEYRNSVMEKQTCFSKQISKLYKLITIYKKLAKPNLRELDKLQSKTELNDNDKIRLINVRNISINLTPPMYLNMVNINESFTNAEPVVDSFVKYIFGEEIEDKYEKVLVQRFRVEMIKMLAPNVDLTYAEDIADKILTTPMEGIAEKIKSKIVSKKLESPLSGELNEDGEGDTY